MQIVFESFFPPLIFFTKEPMKFDEVKISSQSNFNLAYSFSSILMNIKPSFDSRFLAISNLLLIKDKCKYFSKSYSQMR